jgi:hypothetical protein
MCVGEVMCAKKGSDASWSEVDYFIRCVLSILLGVLHYRFL